MVAAGFADEWEENYNLFILCIAMLFKYSNSSCHSYFLYSFAISTGFFC